MTQFTQGWDPDLATELVTHWLDRGYIAGSLIDVEDLVSAVDAVLRSGPSIAMSTVVVAPRPSAAT